MFNWLHAMRKWLANKVPQLGIYKRYLVALADSILPAKESYSQYGEDRLILSHLRGLDHANSIYVDIGGNHPSDISNTYLFYRLGYRGIIIEPNREFRALFRTFRRRDEFLAIGCGNEPALLKFHVSKTPVISSFIDSRNLDLSRSEYVPVLPLDLVLSSMSFELIMLMSVDVEGLNADVLRGATSSLKRTVIVCVEFDNREEIEDFARVLGMDFRLVRTVGCNAIFINDKVYNQLTRNAG